ncbi:hypothetical protein SAMN05880501_109114 [Ureibacillus xyleni]|uniref:Pyrroloquinoline-quinone binding quinoprotein n=1 Tax=Ureibacillus xyleni TaxID=614648 RepID=A0A285T678_9BACL|nr:hypothetical protein [Ureibacillus xyleni]SOC16886.1 hypothetical protein SAMN05880501_109114 [Ureibacillus xyleni]
MKHVQLYIMLLFLFILAGCNEQAFTKINQHQSFVASVNILEPSITFFEGTEEIAKWEFEKAYTGALLIKKDQILLYGHQLDEADLYELSTGKKVQTIKSGIGTTNAYYDEEQERFFFTNSESNTISSFNAHGKKLEELQLGNYPMSMTSHNGKLYVVNYKDTILSVIDLDLFEVEDEWEIEKSSNGMIILPEEEVVWIGGHGEGSKPNQEIDVYNIKTGELQSEINVSLMPIGFSRKETTVFVVNHGSNELFALNLQGKVLWNMEVGANPFVVATYKDYQVVTGYDDHKIYFIKDRQIQKTIETNQGPFQLLVREVVK